MNAALIVITLVTLVGISTVIGLLWKRSQGRVRHTDGRTIVRVSDVPGLRRFATGATLLQFSTEVCAPCAVTRTVLSDVAARHDNVTHVDLDLTHRADLASLFHIMQTPTTLILDKRGVVRARIGGAPRREAVAHEITRILEAA